jgi:hypothetical protein
MTDLLTPGDDFAGIADDETFINALAGGGTVDATDPAKSLLAQWRDELTAAAVVTAATTTLPLQRVANDGSVHEPEGNGHWYRSRGAAGAAALFVVLAASTGVAAAMPGNPVHRALFGGTATSSDLYGARISAMLAEVAAGIDAANAAGGITDDRRAQLGDKLAAAAALLAQDQSPDPALGERLTALRGALAALPALPAAVPDSEPPADGAGSDGQSTQHTSDQGTSAGDGQDADEDAGSTSTSGDDGDGADSSDDGTTDRSGDDGSGDSGDGDTSVNDSDSSTSGDSSDSESSDSDSSSSDGSDSTDVAGSSTDPVYGDGDGGTDSPTDD